MGPPRTLSTPVPVELRGRFCPSGNKAFILSFACLFHFVADVAKFPLLGTHGVELPAGRPQTHLWVGRPPWGPRQACPHYQMRRARARPGRGWEGVGGAGLRAVLPLTAWSGLRPLQGRALGSPCSAQANRRL